MFGGIAAKVNGQMFAGLFAKSFIVKLSEADREEALALDGATPFDPMGNGRVMTHTIQMPEETFGDDAELRAWLVRALDYTVALPPKAAKPAAKKPAAKKPAAKKPAAKQPAAKQPAAKQPAKKSLAMKKPPGKKRR
jgi:TfoX/Sxy family transcriptional regulator of competence genes